MASKGYDNSNSSGLPASRKSTEFGQSQPIVTKSGPSTSDDGRIEVPGSSGLGVPKGKSTAQPAMGDGPTNVRGDAV